MAVQPTFASLGLLSSLCLNLPKLHIHRPTFIQQQAIPILLSSQSHHLLVAEDGKGKTLAWLLPLLHRMRLEDIRRRDEKPNTGSPRALVVVASMTKAQVLAWSLKAIAENLKLRATVVSQGESPSSISQKLSDGFDLFIGTPDSLKSLSCAHTENVVVDDFEQVRDWTMSEIAPAAVPKARLVLSTASSYKAEAFLLKYYKSAGLVLPAGAKIEKTNRFAQQSLKHSFVPTNSSNFHSQLLATLQTRKRKISSSKCIIFCPFHQQVNKVAMLLQENDFTCAVVHSELSEKTVTRTMWKFARGLCKVLIMTEVSARKLAIERALLVVNLGLPATSKDYEYRAQYAQEGCITLASTEDQAKWTEFSGVLAGRKQIQTESQVLSST